jgi:putative hydrolase of the HAD superfamily
MFDFGGTIDTNGIHWSEIFKFGYQKYGLVLSDELFNLAYVTAQKIIDSDNAMSNKNLFETITMQIYLQNEIVSKNLNREFCNQTTRIYITSDIYELVKNTAAQAIPIIRDLKINRKTAIVSNFNGNLKIVCDELGLTPYMNYLVDSALVNLWKPDPQIFNYCLKMSGVAASECVVVGDSYSRDIAPAKSLGCATIWLNHQSWEKIDNPDKADFTISTFEELKNIIE